MPALYCFFFGSLVLHAFGKVRVDPLLSALLLAFASVPVPAEAYPRFARRRIPAAWAAAALLAWRESWLPPPAAAWHFLTDPSVRPTAGYVAEFLLRAADLRAAAALAAVAAVCAGTVWLARRISLALFCLLGFAAVAATDPGSFGMSPVAREVADFFRAETGRTVRLEPPADPAFDVVVIHVCSLSWEDLVSAGLGRDAFAGSFHALLTGFGSATSYSNPASLRLLRAPCGQVRHQALFLDDDPSCYLLEQARGLGFATSAANNHDGTYDHYAEVLTAHAKADVPMGLEGVPVMKLNFNGTDIFSDQAVLSKWWKIRLASGAPRAFLYYNTVSLHQGAHVKDQKGDWFADRRLHYKEAFDGLRADLGRFFADLEASGRRVVVLVVAEHGAALEGSTLQAPDLREIPLPALTEVPVAVRVIGPGAPPLPQRPVESGARVSYLALAELLGRLLKSPPFPGDLSGSLAGLPETAAVSENENALVYTRPDGAVFVRRTGGRWVPAPSDGARSSRPSAR